MIIEHQRARAVERAHAAAAVGARHYADDLGPAVTLRSPALKDGDGDYVVAISMPELRALVMAAKDLENRGQKGWALELDL